MPNKIILQGITDDNHETAVRRLLSLPNPERIVIGVAFLNAQGLLALGNAIAPVAAQTTFFVGIRNGITTAQGLIQLLRSECSVYVVDTGSRSILFHPKIYAARNAEEARLIVGSANLTRGGLNSNIEASLCLSLSLGDAANATMVTGIEKQLYDMPSTYPDNVFSIPDVSTVQRLLDSGCVVDEDVVVAPTPVSESYHSRMDAPITMRLRRNWIHMPLRDRPKPDQSPSDAIRSATSQRPRLVWQSKPLTRRDLTIPEGTNTNPTGSMLFTKGTMNNIDQRHYFRDEVFGTLDWRTDPEKPHIERASAKFQMVIAGVDHGTFELRVSHNARTDSKAYKQKNGMTHLHWGDARPLVARPNLLDRTMCLYKAANQFVLEID